jgi:hypothetical protein
MPIFVALATPVLEPTLCPGTSRTVEVVAQTPCRNSPPCRLLPTLPIGISDSDSDSDLFVNHSINQLQYNDYSNNNNKNNSK